VKTARLEAFSDGVFAVIITIMVLEMKVPHGSDVAVLRPVLPVFLSYVLSFVYLGIYWNNHHHMFHAVTKIHGPSLWANLHLLFWLSLIPFVTGWMGENNFATWPVALYGIVLLCAACAYTILEGSLIKREGKHSTLAAAVGKDIKAKISILLNALAIPFAFINPWLSCALYVLVAIIWLIPDPRIERTLAKTERATD
jgi:uncharacterized membrane protein